MKRTFLVLLATIIALGFVACEEEEKEAAAPTATPTAAVAETPTPEATGRAQATPTPEATPSMTMPELRRAVAGCKDESIPGWDDDEDVRTDWLLAVDVVEGGGSQEEFESELKRRTEIGGNWESNLTAIFEWLQARLPRQDAEAHLLALTKEGEGPLFAQCVRHALVGLTPAPEPPTGRTRGAPIPFGQTLEVPPGWEVTVIDVNPDAWPVIQAENMFNDPPEEGYRMVLITLRVVNVQAADKADTITESDFEVVGSRNQVYKTFDRSCGVTPNDLSAELFPQGTAEGTVCFQAGVDETGLLLIASLTWDDKDRRYFALE